MKIYLASNWKDRRRIKLSWIEPLKEMGHTITHDWTVMEDERLDTIGNPLRDVTYHKDCAIADINGVIEADLLLVIMDSPIKFYSYRGTWTEIGTCLGANEIRKKMGLTPAPIILYNPWIDSNDINDMAKHSRNVTNVFFWHDTITRVTTGNQVFREIAKHAKDPNYLKRLREDDDKDEEDRTETKTTRTRSKVKAKRRLKNP